jgi:hypothetical protein
MVLILMIKKTTSIEIGDMGWANQKVQPKTKKKIMHISKVFTFLTYLFT